ncbi:hypothetical protein IC575_009199 [Cucumis melo]
MDLLLFHLQNKMLHIKQLCKYIFRVIDSAFIISCYSLFFSIEFKLHNYILTKFFYLFFKTRINKLHCIVWQRLFDTHVLTTDNKKGEWTNTTAHLNLWTKSNLKYYFNTAPGDFQDKQGWGDVNYVIDCINLREHWLAIAADMRKYKIYVFDSMPNYVEKKLVDEALEIPARCIPSLVIVIGMNLHSKRFKYSSWPVVRSNTTLQKGRSGDCGIFCSKFIECLVTNADHDCLTVENMKLLKQQYVPELWTNKYFW